MTTKEWTHIEYADATGREIARMAEAVRGHDPATPVPTCPGWDLAELVAHTGAVHRWAAAMVRDLAPRRYDRQAMDHGLPSRFEDYPAWLEEGAVLLVEALKEQDPDAEMWSWAGDRHARFWSRRQLHETVIHRADVELAVGAEPSIAESLVDDQSLVDEDVAADGVSELLDVLPYASWRPLLAELRGDGETISWQPGTGTGWLIRLTPDGFSYERSSAPGQSTVRTATARDVLLMAWGRRRPQDRPEDYVIEGDSTLLRWWAERSAI
ncbi:maleylpyruvate isomerase family mycothiol-dependent enzyme [Planotetraspora sp. A-T 1434]|uniref:maleylpyruvate isomerase family mycothiol-dependent enzyme n=1 Tax=Planotetraspora sp. A-T 1434 TaxID=2979219 RepID=UPI0021BE5953|nr:maleylpyruvate isomerase family mycothiol-dependent enzyme [Planotetraspora sp. A-T 1434]MCT9930080.1 maleylpyruvate isomerase family mycothiol-dependent enzyme [Planotetraspora sp. A-T 1434]